MALSIVDRVDFHSSEVVELAVLKFAWLPLSADQHEL